MKKQVLFCLVPLIAVSLGGCKKKDSSSSPDTPKYTITWNNYDGTLLEKDEKVPKGSMPQFNGATPTKADDELFTYEFAGWDPEVRAVDGDETYTAVFTPSRIQYVINFDLQGGESPSYIGPVAVESFSASVFFFDVVKEDYNFRGWSYNGVRIFDEKGRQLANPELARSMTFVAIFSQTVKLSIIKNINAAGEVDGEGEYAYNTNVEISAEAASGYIFDGWYVNDELVSTSEIYNFRMWSDDVVLEARFIYLKHELKIKSNNVEKGTVRIVGDENVAYYEEDVELIEYSKQVTIVANTLQETRFLGWFDEHGELVDTNAVYSFVMPDEDVSLYAKWNYFKLDIDLSSGHTDQVLPDHYTDGNDVSIKIPEKEYCIFSGWTLHINGEVIREGAYDLRITSSIKEDIKIFANWIRVAENLMFGSSDWGKGKVRLNEGTGEVNRQCEIQALPRDGYKFIGWFNSLTELCVSTSQTYSFYVPETSSGHYTLSAHFMSLVDMGIKPVKDHDSISYGLYAKDRVEDQFLLQKIASVGANLFWNFYYYYEEVYFYDSGRFYTTEPVKWNLLDSSSRTYVSEDIIEASQFASNESSYMWDYLSSDVRLSKMLGAFATNLFHFGKSYLNIHSSFSNAADTTDNIYNPYVHASDEQGYNYNDEYPYILSYKDMINGNYGFSTAEHASKSRQATMSDLARDRGLLTNSYWTRSPSSLGEGREIWAVNQDGALVPINATAFLGIRPVVSFNESIDAI